MNAVSHPSLQGDDLLDIIDFKWLMIGTGHHVHVEQMQSDPNYARTCLALGANSGIAALRVSARRVARRLGLALPGELAPAGAPRSLHRLPPAAR